VIQQLKRLAGDSFLYALMSVSTKLIAFVMFPIYIKFLPPAEFGTLGIIDATISILGLLIIFGTDTALGFYYFEEKDENKRMVLVQNVMGLRLLISVVVSIIILLLGDTFSEWLGIGPTYLSMLYLSVGVLWLDSINLLILTVYRFETKTVKVVLFTITKMALIALFSFLFLLYVSQSLGSIVLGRALSAVIVLLLSGKQLLTFFRLRFDRDLWKKVIYYGAPLVPASLSFWVIGSANRYIIAGFSGLTDVGIYEAAFRFAAMISLLTYGIQMAWRPYSMQMKDHPEGKQFFASAYYIIFAVGMVGIVVVTSVIPWVFMLIDAKYQTAFQYVGFLSFTSFLNFYYLIVSTGLLVAKKTKTISTILMIAMVLNVLLNVVLYQPFALWGIVISNAVTLLFTCTVVFIQSQKYFYVPVHIGKLMFLLIQSILTMAAMVYVQLHDLPAWYQVVIWIYFLLTFVFMRIDRDIKELKPSSKS
jgi:O-antigen/teichoic acid export membrane protein